MSSVKRTLLIPETIEHIITARMLLVLPFSQLPELSIAPLTFEVVEFFLAQLRI